MTTRASSYPAKLCMDITLSCTQGLSTDEGPWGFEADVGDPELDDETPEDALFAHTRPGSKHYIVSLSESFHWKCIRNMHISPSKHINIFEAVAFRLLLRCCARGTRCFSLQDSRVNLGAR